MPENPGAFTATEALNAMISDEITSEQLVQSCFSRIEQRDDAVRAWECISKDLALQQARDNDRQTESKPLHGIPIGVKDIIDTDDLPTGYGSPIFSGHQPTENADCVNRLKAAGAIILGKTVTTEFAYLHPGMTRNPHDVGHTPGGSSSGSAAAVADKQVPLALGTQTAGSIIRPASYCGVIGYKPTFNNFSCEGIHAFAPSLDTLGGFARSVADIVLLRNVLVGDSISIESIQPDKIALLQGPYWQEAEDETRLMFEQLQRLMGESEVSIEKIDLGQEFAGINDAQKKIQLGECTQTLNDYYLEHKNDFSGELLADYEYGLSLNKKEMTLAYATVESCKKLIAGVFSQHQFILTASSPGTAPKGLEATGDPVFCRMWTAMGLPCISLPFPRAAGELPLGVQLVGPANGDVELLAYATWFEELLKNSKH